MSVILINPYRFALAGPTRTYIGASESPTISGSTFTITAASIGTGYTHLVVGIWGAFSSGRTWTGLQVGSNFSSSVVTAASAQGCAAIAIVDHTGNATDDIVFTASGTGGLRGGLIWWGINNLTSATPADSATDNAASANAVDTGSKTVSGPLVWFGVVGSNSATSLTTSWSQGTEDRDVTFSSGRTFSGASAADTDGLSAETISATFSGAPTLPSLAWAAWQ